MKKIKRTIFIEEKGLTLVEVLASFVILSIVLVIFLSIFAQTTKTNQTSEEIVDATYIAQTEMERVYEMSINNEQFIDGDYEQQANEDSWEVYYKTDVEPEHLIKVRTKPLDEDEEMVRVIVEVYDNTDSPKIKAQMENLLKWGSSDEE